MKKHLMQCVCASMLIGVLAVVLQGSGVTSAAYNLVQNAGSNLTQRPTLNCSTGLTCSDDPTHNRTTIAASGGGSSFYQTIQQAGTPLAQEPVLNFPSNMTCVDNPGNTSTDCTPSGGGGSATVHHLIIQAAYGTTASGFGSTMNYGSGTSTTFLGAIPMGILTGFNSTGGANQSVIFSVYLPSTWTGAVTINLETGTQSNNTGSYSFVPNWVCVANGFDYGAAPSYTSGSAGTATAPGGAGTGFYRERVTMTFTPACSTTNTLLVKLTKGTSDTYADTVSVYYADFAYTY